jgi:hypothetical protein
MDFGVLDAMLTCITPWKRCHSCRAGYQRRITAKADKLLSNHRVNGMSRLPRAKRASVAFEICPGDGRGADFADALGGSR